MKDSHSLCAIAERRYSRRGFLKLSALLAVATAMPRLGFAFETGGFVPLPHGVDGRLHLAEGYQAQVLLRWGDGLFPNMEAFEPGAMLAQDQARRFGYNNDFTAFLPLPWRRTQSERGLLVVNHESVLPKLMFAERGPGTARVEMQAVGHSIVEVLRDQNGWRVDEKSRYTRRITASTPMRLSGPAAGHARLRTNADPSGRLVMGTFQNCAGGVTPWGTVLIAEENIDEHFAGRPRDEEERNHLRMGVDGHGAFAYWGREDRRFDLDHCQTEPNRFGWIVEIDPFDPHSMPVKRTALGRFKHEGACCVLAPDGRLVVYMGDDDGNEYLYRFVTDQPWAEGKIGGDLLDSGVLSVAQFDDRGFMRWVPLVAGEGPLHAGNGFVSQGDVLIEARRAADLRKATPMDRPEGVTVDPESGTVYVALTHYTGEKEPNAANPLSSNPFGHVLSLNPPQGDHAADEFDWALFLTPGKNLDAGYAKSGLPTELEQSPLLACPDNLAFANGMLWVATDGMGKALRVGDGLFAVAVSGPEKGLPKRLLTAPQGAEVTGPSFTPDGKTLFLSIQHPGEGSRFAEPSTRWPDFVEGMPPRPSVIAVTREDGGVIGT